MTTILDDRTTQQVGCSWKQRFRAARFHSVMPAKAAPDRGLVITNLDGSSQLHAWDVPGGGLRPLTHEPAGLLRGTISPDGRYVYYFADENGNELGHFVRVPYAGGPPEDLSPALPPYSGVYSAISVAGNLVAFQAYGEGILLRELARDGSLGPVRKLRGDYGLGFGPLLSHDGQVAALIGWLAGNERASLLAVSTASGEVLAELGGDATIGHTGGLFSPAPGDLRVAGTDYSSGYRRPLVWSILTGERTDLCVDGPAGDLLPVDWSLDGARILLAQSHHATLRFHVYHLDDARLAPVSAEDDDFTAACFGPPGTIIAVRHNSALPPEVLALDEMSGSIKRVLLAADPVPPGRRWRSVTFASTDGQEIQGWLATPGGNGPFPAILDVHGGPYTVTADHFSPQSQCWLDHGFAFLTINYSGSLSFGGKFQARVVRNPGLPAVEDMAAARNWLVAKGIARADAVFASGWSHGGYLTLLALGRYPDLWAGGMAGAAVADWTMHYEAASHESRGFLHHLLGGAPGDLPFSYARRSPYFYAGAVRAPVLIMQGRSDTNTPLPPIEVYAHRLRELGRDVELHIYDGGHTLLFSHPENAIQHQELMLRFARRVLDRL